jgi:Carboxypeptidase regulatory-like domain/FlgD Ig-like domain
MVMLSSVLARMLSVVVLYGLRNGLIEEVDPTLKFVPTSRRYAALAVFMTALVGITAVANAQRRERQTPSLGKYTVPLRAFSGVGDNRYLSPSVTARELAATGAQSTGGTKSPTRVQIGGPNGSNVQEKVVDATFSETTDERHPYWTDDELTVYFAKNSGTATSSHYQLHRISSSVVNNPQQNGAGVSVALTNEPDADHWWPTPDRSGGRLAFVKSVDNRILADPLKTWQLYVAVTPAPGNTIDKGPGGTSNLLNLTGDPQRFRGKKFVTVGRACWIGTTDLLFSGQLEGDTVSHLYTVNVVSRRFTQLTGGVADERNPVISPDGRYVAFDSTARPTVAGNIYVGGGVPATDVNIGGENVAVATGLNLSGKHNIFVMAMSTGTVTQFTNRYAGAPDSDDVQPAFSASRSNLYTNTTGASYFIAFASTRQPDLPGAPTAYTAGGNTHDVYAVLATNTATSTGSLLVEGSPLAGAQSAKQIDTADPGFLFDDQYPTWSPFINSTRVAFQSNRVGSLQTGDFGEGFRTPGSPTPSNYSDICLATVLDVSAPTLIRFDTSTSAGEIVHINPVRPGDTRTQPYDVDVSSRSRASDSPLYPGQEAFFTVRVDDREAGVQSVWLQFKNPNSKYQSLAQGGLGVEHKEYAGTHYVLWEGSPPTTLPWMSADGTNRVGVEYEAQVVGLDGVTYFNHSTIGGPIYTPAGRDRFAFTGTANPPMDGTGGRPNAWLRLQPLIDPNTNLPIRPADGRGGVLYGAKWRLPSEASDWIIDVIAYDNATNPFGGGARNWIIYDNVWGFSTAVIPNSPDVDTLFVSDNTLGQKFFLARPGEIAGNPDNAQPVSFGAESYYTDPTMTRYPQEMNPTAVPAPGATDLRAWSQSGPLQLTGRFTGRNSRGAAVNPGVIHPLGVGSYVDPQIEFTPVVETNGSTYALPNTGRYTIWRTLCRGPVPQELMQAYLPYAAPAPADVVAGETAERTVRVKKRLIVWAAPFIGNIFVGPGSLADLKTQERLTNYVENGGALFVSGMDIGFALAGNGQSNAFYSGTLKARYVADNGGNGAQSIVAVGTTTLNNDAWPNDQHLYGQFDGTNWVYSAPRTAPISATGITGSGPGDGSRVSNTSGTQGATQAFVDSIAPLTGATLEYNYDNGAGALISSTTTNGGRVYYAGFGFESIGNEWYTQTVGSTTVIFNRARRAEIMTNFLLANRTGTISGRIIDDNGSPVADALVRAIQGTGAAVGTALTDASGNFIIQGLPIGTYNLSGYRQGFYTQHGSGYIVQAANDTKVSLKLKRANPAQLSNIRKSTTPLEEGGVFALDGKTGIGGVEVQARRINADGTMNIASAVSSDGTDGRRPGAYLIPDLLIWDDGYEVLVNAPTRPDLDSAGRPQFNTDGTLKTVVNPLYRAELTNLLVGQQPQSGVVLGTGTLIQNRPVTGQANRYRLIVVEDQTSQMDFLLGGQSQKVTGTVLDSVTNNPIANAFVTAVDQTSGATVASATTDAAGKYTLLTLAGSLDKIPASTYTITASALGYNTVPKADVVVGGSSDLVLPVFLLTPLADGSVSGTVRKVTGDALEGGVTVRFYIIQNGIVSPTPAKTITTAATLTTDGTGYSYNFKTTLSPGQYEVIGDKTGLTTDPTPLPRLTVTTATERQSYNFRMQPAKVYSDGVQLISTPGLYAYTGSSAVTTRGIFGITANGDNDGDGTPNTSNDQSVYNLFNVADWTGTEYSVSPDLQIQVGKGYFVKFGAPISVSQVGTALPGSTFTVTLAPGWNLIGHPFVNPTSPNTPAPDLDLYAQGQIQEEGAAAISMTQAVQQGKVRGVLFAYSGSNNGSQYYQANVMKPWFGYWFRNLTNQPVKLILSYPVSRSVTAGKTPVTRAQRDAVVTRSIQSRGVTDWRMQLAVKLGNYVDTDNAIGVAPDAKDTFDNKDTEKPSMVVGVPGIYLSLEGVNETGRSASFADVIRAATPGTKTWNFTVESTQSGKATLFIPNADRLPKGLDAIATDMETGKRFAIRSASAYSYQAVANQPHRFRIEVSAAKTRVLAINNLRVAANSRGQLGTSYRVNVAVTQDSDLSLEVKTFGGRTVRQIQTRASGVGETSIVWDGRDSQGANLPAGAYRLVVTAKDSTGATVRREVPFGSVH